VASYRDLSDVKSREAYEKLMHLFEKKIVGFHGKKTETPIAGSALADFIFENGKSVRV
jgi:hypothetical protein